jgi:hypothetical protein
MSDAENDPTVPAGEPAGETSIQKALRLKKATIDARPTPPKGGKFQREQAARIASGKSKPWMSR